MAALLRTHASDICNMFWDVSPTDCLDHTSLVYDRVYMDERWAAKVKNLFWKFHSELAFLLHCNTIPDCDTRLFLHTMQHIAYLLRHTLVLSLWAPPAHKIYDMLALMLHGDCITCSQNPKKVAVCALIPSVETPGIKKHFAVWKKDLKVSLCRMSSNYLCTTDRLHLQPRHPRAAVDTLFFKELYDLVVNKGDKRLAILFVSMLPEIMGATDISGLLQSLSMHMHTFVNQVIKWTEGSTSRKFIRMFFGAAGRCTCHTKCSMYGKVDDIQVLAVCKTCRNSPVLRQKREPRCRRTISSTSFMNVCNVDGNTSFIYVPLYRACVNTSNGQFIYEHWAYTLSLNLVVSDSDKASIYMLCVGGRRTCTNVFFTDSLAKTLCERCRQGNLLENTCLTGKVGNKLAALCDGCIIAACCPLHAPLRQTTRELWLSILEYFAK
jgi:hypothetical protein